MPSPPQPRRKLLVIDDDPVVTQTLSLKLLARYEVVVLHEPTEALATVRRERPDLVVCDVEMPGMTGPAVARTLASCEDTADVSLVFLTGAFSTAELQARGGALEGRPGLSKHAPLREIVSEIEAAAQGRRPHSLP